MRSELIKLKVQLLIMFFVAGICFVSSAAEIWVSKNGKDTQDGTRERPLATLNMALRKARELRRLEHRSVAGGIYIILTDGTFYLEEPIFIRPEDSGTTESPTIIEAGVNAQPVLSGGVEVRNWEKAGAVNRLKAGVLWVADAPQIAGEVINFRQLWVNGKKAVRAKSTSGNEMDSILSWDKQAQTCWIPVRDKSMRFEAGMEMFIQQWWAIANLRIKDIEVQGDSARLSFMQPESRIQSEHPWPAPWISAKTGNSPFFLNNAISLLDEPGEWYLDRKSAKIYYYPAAHEDINSVKVIAPVLENLVQIKGTIDYPVHDISFKGISFKFCNWLRPSQSGHVPLQAGMYLLDAYKLEVPGTPGKAGLENQAWIGRPQAAVAVNYAHNIQFEGCTFQHLSSTGLDFHRGTNNNIVRGNLFKDIGGSAINMGVYSDEAFEAHLPYYPKDVREVCSDEMITDNLITNVANEDWGTVGIGAGFVKNITIAHNEISDVSYTGISLGWGWTKSLNAMSGNKIIANKIHHYGKYLYDVAAIYTLSAQPKSRIENNYIDSIYFSPYAHDPYHWFYLYTDEGSSYISVKNNWVPAEKFLQNANGPGNTWQKNNAFVHDSVRRKAGIRNPYRQLLKEVVIDRAWPLQDVPHFAALELNGPKLDVDTIKTIAKANGVIGAQVYRWKDKWILYAKLNHLGHLKTQLALVYPKVQIKTFNRPMYNFSNFERCKEPALAEEWEHVVFITNPLDNPKRQQEYVDYHKTQYEQRPEVTEEFCRADVQQVQTFKNGKQWLLVISIAKGTSPDELKHRLAENSPGLQEWNELIKKYLTGMKGGIPDEPWVMLNNLTE